MAGVTGEGQVPIYDYVCSACGREIEVVHAISASGPERCEACGGPMRKALSAPAIHFKGSGWAKKDARSTSGPVAKGAKPGTGDGAPATPAGGDGATGGGSGGDGASGGGSGGTAAAD